MARRVMLLCLPPPGTIYLQSLGISHPSLLASVSQQADVETFASASTAILPPRYRITLALPPRDFPPPAEELHAQYVRGEEILSDGWRRPEEGEGLLEERRKELRQAKRVVRPLGQDAVHEAFIKVPDSSGPLWYTAVFRIQCLCQLPRLPRAHAPSRNPPTTAALALHSPDSRICQIPQIGTDILQWSSATPPIDLDPALDELDEFEHTWHLASGFGWDPSITRISCDDLPLVHGTPVAESAETRRRRKGKGREDRVDRSRLALPPDAPETVNTHAVQKFARALSYTETALPQEVGWAEEAKRRKAWWRALIRSSLSSGQLFTILPRPHSYDPPFVSRDKWKRPKDVPLNYVLPRFFASSNTSHPFHPDLSHYISQNPGARVHWIIPIHGPVVLTSWSDPITDTHPPKGGLIPSPGELTENLPASDPLSRPAALHWTPELVRHLMISFLIPLHVRDDGPFGPLSIRLSGPKPDPFLALTPSPPLLSHRSIAPDKPGGRPIRPETGDHIRVYCDASRALGLRTWFHGIEVDRSAIKAGEGVFKPFHRVRLVLVGERGEALIVA